MLALLILYSSVSFNAFLWRGAFPRRFDVTAMLAYGMGKSCYTKVPGRKLGFLRDLWDIPAPMK
jgi:hypothetical protein